MNRKRRGVTLITGGFMAMLLSIGAIAWACTSHLGDLYFCSTTTSAASCGLSTEITSWSASAAAKNKLFGSYDATFGPAKLRYALTSQGENACHNSNDNFGTFSTNGDGDWYVDVTMPGSSGNYTACAKFDNQHISNHKNFSVT
ncbi:MAG: hypothetical protein ACRDJ4_07200 [Actinomycetota bacterium]